MECAKHWGPTSSRREPRLHLRSTPARAPTKETPDHVTERCRQSSANASIHVSTSLRIIRVCDRRQQGFASRLQRRSNHLSATLSPAHRFGPRLLDRDQAIARSRPTAPSPWRRSSAQQELTTLARRLLRSRTGFETYSALTYRTSLPITSTSPLNSSPRSSSASPLPMSKMRSSRMPRQSIPSWAAPCRTSRPPAATRPFEESMPSTP